MKISQMQYFSTVCMTGNFTRAAEILHIAQPSITAAIKSLESELGVSLLHRGKKKVSPTPEGERFLLKCNHILSELDEVSLEYASLREAHKSISVGMPPMVGSFLFPLIFSQYKKRHPEITINLTEAGSVDAQELVLNGELDMAIIAMGDVPPTRLNSQILVNSELLYCVGSGHRLAGRGSIDFSEIGNDPLILFSQGYYHRNLLEQRFRQEQIAPNVLFHSNQLLTICSFIRDNLASGFLMPEVAEKFEDIYPLKIHDPLKLNVGIVWRKDDYVTDEASSLIEFCRKAYRSGSLIQRTQKTPEQQP